MNQPDDNDHDVVKENPFLLKDTLKDIARRTGPQESVIDLSRGDPLDPPSLQATAVELFFESFAFHLQRKAGQLGNDISSPRTTSITDIEDAWEAAENVSKSLDSNIVSDAQWVRQRLSHILADGGTNMGNRFLAIIARGIQGAGYGDPLGDMYVRATIAAQTRDQLSSMRGLTADNIAITAGASQGISAIFKLLWDIGYLNRGSIVGCMSPVYSPYNDLAERYGLSVIALECDPENAYEPTNEQFSQFKAQSGGMKLFSLVNPSNPTGRAFSKKTLQRLAEILDYQGTILIEDTVYRKLVTGAKFHSIHEFAPASTIVVESASKYFRSTGLRFGFVIVSPDAMTALEKRLQNKLNHYIGAAQTAPGLVMPALIKAKAPAPDGIFQHTEMVSRPVQWKGLMRMLLSSQDGGAFTNELQERWDSVYKALEVQNPQKTAQARGLTPGFVPYYCLIDGSQVLRNRSLDPAGISPWAFIKSLARNQVVVLPAAKFFGKPEEHQWVIRISVANQTLIKLNLAMDRFREVTLQMA